MKKIIFLLAILTLPLSLFSCGGGGGSGSADQPPGENPGGASVVQLWPSHYIAQTNAYITLYAKVLDGNGAPVPNIDVSFTNLSSVGILSSTSAKTDGTGLAKVTLSSTTPGFSTIIAQVNTSQGIVRDRKSVFFSTKDVLSVSMDMDVDSVPGNGTFNEANDFILFENSTDDTFKVRATVYDAGGNRVAGTLIDWSASHSEVTFVRTDSSTNSNGVAEGIFKVEPSSIRNTDTTINIMASAGNGAANMVTLFLRPVTVNPGLSSVTANPNIVDLGGESTITAVVMLNTGSRAPDGTVVNFSASCGSVTPFAETTGGVATATFTAPLEETTCYVTSKVGGVQIGQAGILVVTTTKLDVFPTDVTVRGIQNPDSDTSDDIQFAIHGGVAPYQLVSNNQAVIPNQSGITGNTFKIDPDRVNTATNVSLRLYDSKGDFVDIKVTVNPEDFYIRPQSVTIPVGYTATFEIFGGDLPFTIYVDRPADVQVTYTGGRSFSVRGLRASTVTVTVRDVNGRETTTQVKIQ